LANDRLASLRLGPVRVLYGARALKAPIQFGKRQSRHSAKLSDRHFAQLTGTWILNPSLIALQPLESVYTQLPQHPSSGLQLQAKRRIGKL
jgi:hypothetical protein